jgi:GNAT superfamily N-acetyltransferase
MTIRAVRSEDFEMWLTLWEGYNSFYKRSISQEVTQTTWKRFLDADEPVHALVAEIDGEVVGFTAYLFHRHTAMIHDVCYLQDLFTNEKFRGRGIAKTLIQAVSDRAKENGSVQVYWMTHESNETARALYDKVAKHSGFIVYSKRA